MKKIFFILASAALLLTACHNDEEHRPAEGEGRLSFQVINYQQYSLDDETTRATETPSVDSLGHLDMAVYDVGTNALIKHIHQTKGENGYGNFSVALPYGEYNIVFLGYKENKRLANVDSPTAICFRDDFVPNFFYKTLAVTINKPETEAQNIVMQRAVAAFNLKSRGSNPTNLKTMSITSHGGSHHFNALTGYGNQTEDRTYTFDVQKQASNDSLSITFYTFLTAEECVMSFTATARDTEEEILRTREFTNVPMKINLRTRYVGQFFATEQGFASFVLNIEDKEWDNTEIEY